MAKLWQKSDSKMDPLIEAYTAGTDYIFDLALMPFDITATRAHAKGLQKIGIITHAELDATLSALDSLARDLSDGKISITAADEDCHTVIENYVVAKIGEAGKKIHTGRSRNDQILVATRLYMKGAAQLIRGAAINAAEAFLASAKKYQDLPMPGYTHTQQAMLSSVGHYYAAFVESLIDDIEFLASIEKYIDKNPLGSAAGFGTSIPIDREFTTNDLAFASTQVNSLYCQNSRGKFESAFMEGLAQIMLTLGKFANDTLVFTSIEFDFFAVKESITTGSSIMPQKKNLDIMEVLRGNVSVVLANQMMIKDISKNLLSGYNRDLQLIKKPLIESVKIVKDSLEIVGLTLNSLEPKKDTIRSKISPGIFAADIANAAVQERGVAFRDAYKEAMAQVGTAGIDAGENIKSKVSLGAPGNLDLASYAARLQRLRAA